MKKIKLFAATAMIAMVATAGYFGYSAYKQANMTDAERMMMANLEALTSGEQPDVNDCVYDPDTECWALHPTDPSKDIERRDSRW